MPRLTQKMSQSEHELTPGHQHGECDCYLKPKRSYFHLMSPTRLYIAPQHFQQLKVQRPTPSELLLMLDTANRLGLQELAKAIRTKDLHAEVGLIGPVGMTWDNLPTVRYVDAVFFDSNRSSVGAWPCTVRENYAGEGLVATYRSSPGHEFVLRPVE